MQRREHRLVARRRRFAAPARVVGVDAGCAREITEAHRADPTSARGAPGSRPGNLGRPGTRAPDHSTGGCVRARVPSLHDTPRRWSPRAPQSTRRRASCRCGRRCRSPQRCAGTPRAPLRSRRHARGTRRAGTGASHDSGSRNRAARSSSIASAIRPICLSTRPRARCAVASSGVVAAGRSSTRSASSSWPARSSARARVMADCVWVFGPAGKLGGRCGGRTGAATGACSGLRADSWTSGTEAAPNRASLTLIHKSGASSAPSNKNPSVRHAAARRASAAIASARSK